VSVLLINCCWLIINLKSWSKNANRFEQSIFTTVIRTVKSTRRPIIRTVTLPFLPVDGRLVNVPCTVHTLAAETTAASFTSAAQTWLVGMVADEHCTLRTYIVRSSRPTRPVHQLPACWHECLQYTSLHNSVTGRHARLVSKMPMKWRTSSMELYAVANTNSWSWNKWHE